MNSITLIDLASKWEKLSIIDGARDGSDEAKIENARKEAYCKGLKNCASELRQLVSILGGVNGNSDNKEC